MNLVSRTSRIRRKSAGLAMAGILTVGSLVVAGTPVLAASGPTIYINPAATVTSPGATISVDIVGDSGTALVSGIGASIQWDKTKLNLQSITKGADWLALSGSFVGIPAATGTNTIAAANTNGYINGMGVSFLDGASTLSGVHTFLTLSFAVLNGWTGDSPITLNQTNVNNDTFLDGAPATYGNPLASTQVGGTVSIPVPTQTPTPTPTPVPTPTPTVGPANGTVTVTGTVAAGFLALTCPTSVAMPLVRLNTNTKDVVCNVYSDGSWNLSVTDPSPAGPTHGHMVAGSLHLADAFHVINGATNVNLETGGTIATGSGSVAQTTTLSQLVQAIDAPGAYGISLFYNALSSF